MGGWVDPRGWPGRPGVELERPKLGNNHLHIFCIIYSLITVVFNAAYPIKAVKYVVKRTEKEARNIKVL
jgi:hypothetical protein